MTANHVARCCLFPPLCGNKTYLIDWGVLDPCVSKKKNVPEPLSVIIGLEKKYLAIIFCK